MRVTTSLAEREKLSRSRPGEFWTLNRISDALGAGVSGNTRNVFPRGVQSFTAVSTDTRAIAPGEVFVALSGDNFDAHDFLPQAVASGAAAIVASNPEKTRGLGVPVFLVDNTLHALGQLGRYRRRAWGGSGGPVVGITGTNGKTSTKELTAAALGSRLDVHATSGNLNNQVGVPLTLLALPDSADVAIVEMGTNMPGEIATLRNIADPEISVVTSVGEGHLERLGSVEGVLIEKASIFAGATVAVVPASQPEIANAALKVGARTIVRAGLGAGDIKASSWGANTDGSGWLVIEEQRMEIPLRGAHNLRNAMLAIAVARELGVPLEDCSRGIAEMKPQKMRLEAQRLGKESVLINDAYNANPGSAAAAIEYLVSLDNPGQRVLVIGGMRELGASSAELHERVARLALAQKIDLIAALDDMAPMFERLASKDARVITAPDVDELWEKLRGRLDRRSTILLKASRGVKLERIVPYLKEWAEN